MNYTEYKLFQEILDNPDLREVFGEDNIKELQSKIENFEKRLKESEGLMKHMTPDELDEYAELLLK